MKLYDIVINLLIDHPVLRDSDRRLIWNVWYRQGLISINDDNDSFITKGDFLKAASTESIRRCRQKIQEERPELGPSAYVKEARRKKQANKGTFIYREEL